ncbi:hypothetical protein SS50377_22205 [Spironucleus salmonicida]|nr:hypothetical protein SS50377_22205 [Spironucleus salmonicida]
MLVDKFQNILARKSLNERQITGAVIYHGIIYDSYAQQFNPFKDLCEFVQYFKLFPHFIDMNSFLPFTSSQRIAMYSYSLPVNTMLVLDQNLSINELMTCLQIGLFGDINFDKIEKPITASQPERKDKKNQQQELLVPIEVFSSQKIVPLRISYQDFIINKKLIDIIEQCNIPKHNGINLNNFSIKDILSQSTINALAYQVQLKNPIKDDFTVKSFQAFLTYEQSQDPIVQAVQKVLLEQAVSDAPLISQDIKPLVSLFSFKIIEFKDIFLLGNESLNQLESKIFSFKQLQQYICLSPAYAVEWIFLLGENCKNTEFWEGFLGIEKAPDRLESAKKGAKQEVIIKKSDIIAYVCRVILSKKVPNDSKDGYNDYLRLLNSEEDSWLITFAISLQLQFIGRGNSFIYAHFDVNDSTLVALDLLQHNSFEQIIQRFMESDYIQFNDIKKLPAAEKGFIQLSQYNPLLGDRPQSRTTPSCMMPRSQVIHYSLNSDYVQVKLQQKLIINPILLEILKNDKVSLLISRQHTFNYYKILADQLRQHFVILDSLIITQDVYEFDLSPSFSNQCQAIIPRKPMVIDISSLFVPIKILEGAYLLKYNQNLINLEQRRAISSDGKGSKPKDTKPVISQIEVAKDASIKEINLFNKSLVYKLLKTFGTAQLLVGESQFTNKVAFLDQLFDIYGLVGFQQELLNQGVFKEYQLSVINEYPVINEIIYNKPEDNKKYQPVIRKQNEVTKQLYSIIFSLAEKLPEKFDEANNYFDKLAQQKELKVKQGALKQAGLLSELQIENNSFGDLQLPVQQTHRDIIEVLNPLEKLSNQSVISSPKTQKSVKSSPKTSKPITPAAAKRIKEDELKEQKEKEAEQKLKDQNEINEQQKANTFEEEQQKKEEQQMNWYRQLSIANQYFDQIKLIDRLSKAMATLMLGVNAGIIQPDEQLKFLGEELLEMNKQESENDEAEYSKFEDDNQADGLLNAGTVNVNDMLEFIE